MYRVKRRFLHEERIISRFITYCSYGDGELKGSVGSAYRTVFGCGRLLESVKQYRESGFEG